MTQTQFDCSNRLLSLNRRYYSVPLYLQILETFTYPSSSYLLLSRNR